MMNCHISFQYLQSSPNRLSIVGYIFGLESPDINKARVLELGCSMGGNLIPLAARYKNAKFVGVDLTKKQIEIGKEIVKKLGLKNIELHAKDITTITKEFGEFDYIIVHGVYSWVPEAVREAIMRICGECLSQNGLAYISYNTYPGWKGKEIARDIMLFNMDENNQANTINDGIDVLNYMRQNVGNNFIRKILDDSFSTFESLTPSYIMHEYFEVINEPSYFYEVANLASKNGLEYLAESEYPQNVFPPINNDVKERLINKCQGDRVKFEQYIDFVINKTFRQTIFCKKQNAKNLDLSFSFKFEKLDRLNLAGKFIYDTSIQRYRMQNSDIIIQVGISELLDEINKVFPSSLNVGEFMAKFSKNKTQEDIVRIYNGVAFLLLNNVCHISLEKDKFIDEIPQKTRVNNETLNLAKYKIESANLDNISFFTPRHSVFTMDRNLDHRILALLDGTKDMEQISQDIFKMSKDGIFSFIIENNVVTDEAKILELARTRANSLVNSLFLDGMLV